MEKELRPQVRVGWTQVSSTVAPGGEVSLSGVMS